MVNVQREDGSRRDTSRRGPSPSRPAAAAGRPGAVTLSELAVGRSAVVRGVRDDGDGLGTRLEHVGFLPGTLVRVERRAPMGDPTVYELRGYRMAVRRESAELVEVDEIADPAGHDPVDDVLGGRRAVGGAL